MTGAMDSVIRAASTVAPATTTPKTAAKAGASTGGAAAPAASFHADLVKASEKLEPVKGHPYSLVVSGAHEGMYVNQTDNKRAGEAFAIEYRDGHRCHVYGSGKDEVVIAFAKTAKKADQATTAPAATTPAATTAPAATPATTTPVAVSPTFRTGS